VSIPEPALETLRDNLPDDTKAAAHWWLDWGFAVAPMNHQEKHTRLPWDQWLRRLEAGGHDAITQEFRANDWLCAIVDDQVLVLDADTPEAEAHLWALLNAFGVVPNLIVRTKNGVHVYLRRAAGTYAKQQGYSSEKHPERIDVKTARGADAGRSVVVLPPSPGKVVETNEADTLADLVEVDQAFIDAIFKHNGQQPPRPPEPRAVETVRRQVGTTEAAEILSHIPPDGGYSDWIEVGMGLHDRYDGSDEGLHLFDQWSAGAGNYCGAGELEYKWHSFSVGGGVTWASVCRLAEQHGADLSAIARRYDEDGNRLPTFDEALEAAQALTAESAPDEIESVVAMTKRSTAIERRQVFNAIKKQTGIPLGDLRAAVAQQHQSEETPPIEHARKALAEFGDGNIAYAADTFWQYPGRGVWMEEHPEGVKQKIHAVMPDEDLAGGVVDSVLKLCRTECFHPGARFGEAFEGVNVRNGLLVHNGKEWILEGHRRDLYLLAQLPVEYDPDADCPRFRQFLLEIFAGDPDAQDKALLVLMLIGYTLLPISRFEKFALLIGNGANGKSVLLEVLAALLGLDNVAGVPLDKLGDTFKRAHLHGKLANIVTEIEEGAVIADAEVKALTSGELTTAEHKYRNPFSFRPYATLWAATNHMPHTRDFSDALFRRACVITFNNKFEGDRRDPRLKDALLLELPGILNLALAAIGDVLAGGAFVEPASMMQARRDWRLEADQVLQFVEDCCHLGPGEVRKGVLYRDYKDWALEVGVQRTLSQKSFSNRLARAGVGERRDQHARWYTGITPRLGRRDSA
jgi:putative DNA primase/helicase